VAKLEHVGIVVRREKWAETIAFYEQVFGWHRIREVGDNIVFIGDGDGGRIELIANDVPPLAEPHHGAFVLPLDQVDGAKAILEAAGATCRDVQTNATSGDKLLFFWDPAGNYMQIVGRGNAMGK
jgi:catechol 2,3-dioxygenase-like lactoylglutathione lyase family enzyme